MWIIIITLIIIAAVLVINVAEAIIELDQWVINHAKEDVDGSNNENVKPVKKPTLDVSNFPKSSEDAKAKIERLIKK